MPNWKKVIVSGSNATLAQISASVVPTATTQNLLAIDSSTGGIMQITQSGAGGLNTFANTGIRTGDGFIDGNISSSGNVYFTNATPIFYANDGTSMLSLNGSGAQISAFRNIQLSNAKSLKFGADDDYRISHVNSPLRLDFQEDSTTRMTLSGSNVGIGTITPTSKLNINTTGGPATGSSAALFIESLNGDTSIRIGHNSTTTGHEIKYKGTDSGNNNDLEFLSDNMAISNGQVKWMNVKQDGQVALGSGSLDDGSGVIFLPGSGSAYAGNVGIGTTSPQEKLHVNGGHLEVQNAGNTNIYINAQAGSDATVWFQENGSAKGKIQNDASNDSILITDGANTDTMTLKGQKVGIGTTTPGEALEVVGNISASGDLEARNITASNIQVTNDIALGGNIFSFSGFSFIEGVSANFTGSNVFGSGSSPGANDTAGGGVAHQFTGSVSITGSGLTVVGGGLSADLGNAETTSFVVYNTSTGALTYNNPGLISGSEQIATEISGAFDAVSASIATDITANAVNTFKATGQRSGDSGITGSLELSGTGHITASGNISASGVVIAKTGKFTNLHTGVEINRQPDSNDHGILRINGSSFAYNSQIQFKQASIQQWSIGVPKNTYNHDFVIQHGHLNSNLSTTRNFIIQSSSGNVGIGYQAGDDIGQKLTVEGEISSSGAIHTLSHLTASGNISASGTIYADRIHPNNGSGPYIDHSNDNIIISTGLEVATNITASGTVSASGRLYAGLTNHTSPSFVVYNTANGELMYGNPGLISGSAQIATEISGAFDAVSASIVTNTFKATGQRSGDSGITGSLELSGTGHITASGNISASGGLEIRNITASDNVDIGGDLLVTGLIHAINGLQSTDLIPGRIPIVGTNGRLITSPNLQSSLNGALVHITASGNISASGQLFASLSLDNSPFQTVMYDTSSGQFFFTGSYGGGGGGGGGDVVSSSYSVTSSYAQVDLQDVTDVGSLTTNGSTFFQNQEGVGFKYGIATSVAKRADSGFISDGTFAKTHVTPQHTSKPFYFTGHRLITQGGILEEYPNNFIVFNKAFTFNPNTGGGGTTPDDSRPNVQVDGNIQTARYTSGTGSQDPRSGIAITSNPAIFFFNSDASGSISGSHQIASASAQIKFDTGSSALKVFAGSTNEDLLEVMHISRSGANPRVGIGTNNPIKAFDFKEIRDDDRGGELLIRGSRTTRGADTGDEVGRINFAIDSASFGKIDISGSAAEIVALVDDVDETGIQGHMSFRVANSKTGSPTEIFKLSGSKSILGTPLDVGILTPGLSDINASTINRYNNSSTRIELEQNHLEFYGNAYGLKISNTGIDANPGGLASLDFKVRSDNDEKAIFVDSGLDSIQLGSNATTHITASGNISSSAASSASFGSLKIDGASVDFSNLPTSDPGVAGRLYNSSSFIKISAG
mgnify:FL=1